MTPVNDKKNFLVEICRNKSEYYTCIGFLFLETKNCIAQIYRSELDKFNDGKSGYTRANVTRALRPGVVRVITDMLSHISSYTISQFFEIGCKLSEIFDNLLCTSILTFFAHWRLSEGS